MEYKISVLRILHDTIVDGYGFRTSIYSAGCSHNCIGCHNLESWDVSNGTFLDIEDIFKEVKSNSLTNVTFTGGDPMYQAKSFYELAKLIKQRTNKSIWCYTGFTFEEILKVKDDKFKLLELVDVLVDGKYLQELRDITLEFRGSSNQRIINVRESLSQNKIIKFHKYE